MAVRVSGQVKISGAYTNTYFPAHIKSVVGLMSGTKIDKSILPTATESDLGAVKLSADYNASSPGADVVLSQGGAKTLYNALVSRVQNLESPLDYIGSADFNWITTTTSAQITTAIRAYVDANISDALVFHAGHTILIYNEASAATAYKQSVGPAFVTTNGYWLWIYNGVSWDAAIDFPDVPTSDYSGATESAMIAGIITKAMLWKLKGIQTGAQVNTVTSVAGKTGAVTVTKSDVGLANVENKSSETIRGEITSGNVTAALTFTPYNATNPSSYITAAGAPVQSVNSKTGAVTLAKGDVGLGNVDNTADSAKNVLSATKLTTSRKIANVDFNGTADIAIPFANLSTKPTNLSGYGITDAQAKDADLTAIAGLSATSGTLRKTAANTWALDDYMELKIYASAPAVASVPEGRIILVQEEIIT